MFSSSNNQITITQEQAAHCTPHTFMKCQGIPVTLVMADPNDPFVLQITEAIKAFVYQTRYGIRLKMADRAVAVGANVVGADEEAYEVGANEVEEVEHDINYHAKIKKTKNAANGRQQTRREKNAELSNDIRKTTKKIAKVVVTKVYLSSVDNSAGEETTPIATKQTKPTKHELREKTQIRNNKRVYKTHQACSCICNKRNLAVHGCLCT
jgi:hypothetical protein